VNTAKHSLKVFYLHYYNVGNFVSNITSYEIYALYNSFKESALLQILATALQSHVFPTYLIITLLLGYGANTIHAEHQFWHMKFK